jgi:hypothetical protein
MADEVVLLETALVEIAFLASFEYALVVAAAIIPLVDLQMLLQV